MSFDFDDVMEVLQIVKECKDAELHIESGDMKLSIFRGEVGDSARGPLNFSGPVCITKPAKAEAAPAPAAPVATETAEESEAAVAPPVVEEKIEPVTGEAIEEGLIPIKANVTSVFYRKPSPEEPPFVEVGDEVQEDTIVCLLEVMKCFRQVTADVQGYVEKICVESTNLVEEGTVLFLIRPK
jgi:acetyl-CoA carboxylase biotin carboxyl carrier protein